ncbi:MAG TPA: hypothetical protein VK983_01190 [Candidatus Limnocylindrales bacterium]|nr:hypothetical protein [Candidatus Limnocylindrales bacterium]
MNRNQKITAYIKRLQHLAMTAAFFYASLLSLFPSIADAYNQIANRSIQLSSTASGATNVAYKVDFTTIADSPSIGSVVVKFCSNSPILGDSCAVPTGFDTKHGTLELNAVTGNITGLSIDRLNSTANKVVLTRTAGAVAAGAVSFTFGNGVTNGITNPANLNTTFYARIMTFTTTDGSGSESADSVDAGGIAMSTANQLNVTAKVQESLRFCVYTGLDCLAGGNAVTLGDANGVLENTATTYTSTAKFDVSSNAVSGVSVKIKGDTLKSGSFDIAPHGATCTADSTASSVEQFGLRMSVLGTSATATAPYNCAAGSHGFDLANVNTIYGQELAKTAGATDLATSEIELAAKSANTTEAGVYTSKLTLIATATY